MVGFFNFFLLFSVYFVFLYILRDIFKTKEIFDKSVSKNTLNKLDFIKELCFPLLLFIMLIAFPKYNTYFLSINNIWLLIIPLLAFYLFTNKSKLLNKKYYKSGIYFILYYIMLLGFTKEVSMLKGMVNIYIDKALLAFLLIYISKFFELFIDNNKKVKSYKLPKAELIISFIAFANIYLFMQVKTISAIQLFSYAVFSLSLPLLLSRVHDENFKVSDGLKQLFIFLSSFLIAPFLLYKSFINVFVLLIYFILEGFLSYIKQTNTKLRDLKVTTSFENFYEKKADDEKQYEYKLTSYKILSVMFMFSIFFATVSDKDIIYPLTILNTFFAYMLISNFNGGNIQLKHKKEKDHEDDKNAK